MEIYRTTVQPCEIALIFNVRHPDEYVFRYWTLQNRRELDEALRERRPT